MPLNESSLAERRAVSRRSFVITAAGSVLLAGATTSLGAQRQQQTAKSPSRARPLLVVPTDLYRPHDDPDDHWDLATAYALAQQNLVELLAVVIDYPRPGSLKDPDIEAVAQLNYLTGLPVPVLVGSGQPFKEWREKPGNGREVQGVQALLKLMRDAPGPVVISVAGTCRNIAMAAHLDGEIFQQKCAGVYVNAGTSRPLAENAPLEWNVTLDPEAYQAMFALPCPVYWMPCFED
ncbi:MAG: nucleoside hydrolase, partial [Synergistales bacterium]|nr:nucleoside hydrolase [Synergistales bacterium]